MLLSKLDRTQENLVADHNSADWKVALAAALKLKTSASSRWIGERYIAFGMNSRRKAAMNWLFWTLFPAVFAGATAILAKLTIEGVNSHLATTIRTIVVLVFSWRFVLLVAPASIRAIGDLSRKTRLFLALSGVATGLSWLCYFRALHVANHGNLQRIHVRPRPLYSILTMYPCNPPDLFFPDPFFSRPTLFPTTLFRPPFSD